MLYLRLTSLLDTLCSLVNTSFFPNCLLILKLTAFGQFVSSNSVELVLILEIDPWDHCYFIIQLYHKSFAQSLRKHFWFCCFLTFLQGLLTSRTKQMRTLSLSLSSVCFGGPPLLITLKLKIIPPYAQLCYEFVLLKRTSVLEMQPRLTGTKV